MQKNLLSFFLGGILVLAFAPFYCFPAIFIALPGLFLLLEEQKSAKKAFISGFCFGFGFFLFGIYWIANSLLVEPEKFAWLIPFALTLIPGLLACYFGLLGVFYRYFSAKFSSQILSKKIMIFAMLWLFCEVLRANLFSGFPWNLLGYVWLFNPIFAQIAAIFGVYGLSLLACLVALLPLFFWKRKTLKFIDKFFLSAVLLLILGSFLFGLSHKNQQPEQIKTNQNQQDQGITAQKPIRFRIIQANIEQEDRWKADNQAQNLLKHVAMSQKTSPFSPESNQNPKKFDAILWSEASVPFALSNQQTELLSLLQTAITSPTVLISGGLKVDESKKKVWNSVFVIDKNGIKASYDKHHLVPFGEYVPFYRFLSFLLLDSVVDNMVGSSGGGFSEGDGAKTIKLENFSFSPLICYETIFSSEVMNRNEPADFFISVTNDSWFGNSIGPRQHLDIARMRAIEYQRPLLRVAITGISAAINEFGEILEEIPLNEEGIIDIELMKPTATSFYGRFGNWPLLIFCLIICGILVLIKPGSVFNEQQFSG
jgi:apolipoprotein N-acyltransferase